MHPLYAFHPPLSGDVFRGKDTCVFPECEGSCDAIIWYPATCLVAMVERSAILMCPSNKTLPPILRTDVTGSHYNPFSSDAGKENLRLNNLLFGESVLFSPITASCTWMASILRFDMGPKPTRPSS